MGGGGGQDRNVSLDLHINNHFVHSVGRGHSHLLRAFFYN